MNFDSKEEEYFYWWILELKDKGIIESFKYQPKSFELSSDIKVSYKEKLKTKTNVKSQSLLSGHQYKADFLIYWNKDYKDKIFVDYNDIMEQSFKKYPIVVNYSEKSNCYFSVVDVKGNFNQNDAWRRFSIDQKWVFQNHSIFVQKIVPIPDGKGRPASALFKTTFIPNRYQLTDITQKRRKINFEYRLIESYLDSLR
jgi:hypothetical protein